MCVMRPWEERALPQSSCADSEGLFLEHGVDSQYLPWDIPSDHIMCMLCSDCYIAHIHKVILPP